MKNHFAKAAAELLFNNWKQGTLIAELPSDLRPTTREAGYAIQSYLESFTSKPIYGWKIAATSTAGQAHISVSEPIAGRILAERVIPCAGIVPPGPNHMRVAEVEFAFGLGLDLPARSSGYTTKEVLSAVESLHPAIEIPDSRYKNFTCVGDAQLIADNACAHFFVAAEATTADWRSIDLSSHRVIERIEGKLEQQGSGANVLGDPRIALTWLANELCKMGITLKKGQIITTGTCVPPLPISSGDLVTADFGSLGVATVRFA